ncbi:MAG: saccharopine dehydrogenase C-terminal domain-containing protein [bacterium]
METILILGAGRQGLTCGEFLKKHGYKIIVADIDPDNIDRGLEKGFEAIRSDLTEREALAGLMSKSDIAVSALPSFLGRRMQEAAIESGIPIIDLSYSDRDPFELHDRAKDAGIAIVPDAGIAPGTSNFIAGHLYAGFDSISDMSIYVGGIPERRIPPFNYFVTWSANDLIEEYLRPARIIRHGEMRTLPAMTGLEKFSFRDYDDLEAFYTDGLRTLLHTIGDIENLEEKTVRYCGHAKHICFLKSMGFLEEKFGEFSPRALTTSLIEALNNEGIRDIVVMRIEAKGIKDNQETSKTVELFDRGNDELSAMERATGFSCGMFTKILADNSKGKEGVMTPEILGMDNDIYTLGISLLKAEGIDIREL